MIFIEEPAKQIKQGMIVDQIPWNFEGPKPLGIILTNPCDLEHNKASFLIIAALVSAKDTLHVSNDFQNRIQGINDEYQLNNKKWESLTVLIENYIHNKNITRYYFIDPRPIIEDIFFFVDFQFIISVPFEKSGMLVKIAQLSSPFVQQMIVHFAGYTSRIAVDRANDVQSQEIISKIADPYRKI